MKFLSSVPVHGDIVVEGQCHCGGTLVPHKRQPLTWICDRSHWWNRRKHGYLKGTVREVQTDAKEASR